MKSFVKYLEESMLNLKKNDHFSIFKKTNKTVIVKSDLIRDRPSPKDAIESRFNMQYKHCPVNTKSETRLLFGKYIKKKVQRNFITP
jgi:hypothetical protein